jgi:hypothetical protein
MTLDDTPEQRSRRPDDEPRTGSVWGHSLPAAAVCLGGGAAIALISILGHAG